MPSVALKSHSVTWSPKSGGGTLNFSMEQAAMRDLEHGESWSATHVRTGTRRVTRQRGAVTDAAKGSVWVAAAGSTVGAAH